jgi:glycosyltransferase involved in cell wall biosynthesis
MVALTIGMPTSNDFDGVYVTLQALRLYQDLKDTELLVVDTYGCEHTKAFVEGIKARYVLATEAVGTAAAKNRVFAEARGEAVLCCDSHILFAPDAIKRLRKYYRKHPKSIDLLQGPLLHDDLQSISTHFDPVWRDQMWGIWATDARGIEKKDKPFEIPMQGLDVFSCRRAVWPGFHPAFRGFWGEEGYIHEKIRQRGGRCLCLPWLGWAHRFSRPSDVPYPLSVEDQLWNYLIGHMELGLNIAPVLEHFADHLSPEQAEALRLETSGAMQTAHASVTPTWRPASPTTGHEGSQPLVSCICPTYGRPPDYQHLVEEAIESFLRQTYPNKELIVLNDCPGQELSCDSPGVRVVNVPERFPTLGEKYNAAIAMARGDLIAPWEDDDISLPWRLSLSVERLGDADYFNPLVCWYLDGDGLHLEPVGGYGHNLSLYTRAAFEAVDGYPLISGPQDAAMDSALRSTVHCVPEGPWEWEEVLPRGEWYYIYRWGVSPSHLSAFTSDERDFYTEFGQRPVQPGRFVLHPHWRIDYEAETRTMLKTIVAKTQYTPTAITRIMKATYGCDTDVADVTAQLQEHLRNGHLHLIVSNTLFGDPCPNRIKTLRFTYELAADSQQYQHEAEEDQMVSLGPLTPQ